MNDASSNASPWYRISRRELLIWVFFAVVTAVLMNSCRKGMGLFSDREFAARVAQGDALVRTVYDYKARTGQWPQELTSEVLAGAPEPDYRWHYEWRNSATAPELVINPMIHCFAKYRFPLNSAPSSVTDNQWTISGESVRWKSVQSTAIPPAKINEPGQPVKDANR